jgi:hypothetical protein
MFKSPAEDRQPRAAELEARDGSERLTIWAVIGAFVGIAMYLALIGLSVGIAAFVFDSDTVVKAVALVAAFGWLSFMFGQFDRLSRWVDRWEDIADAISDKIYSWWKW